MTSNKKELQLTDDFTSDASNRASKERSFELNYQESPKDGQFLKTIRIWINAFIPQDLPHLTRTVPAGDYVGQTMLDSTSGFFGRTYLTDQRDFSNDISASSRGHSEFMLDFRGNELTMVQRHWCNKTIEINKRNGKEKAQASGKVQGRFKMLKTINPIIVAFKCSASAPLWKGEPSIDYTGEISINVEQKKISYSGHVGIFPAFEMYVQINGEFTKKIFNLMPSIDTSPKDIQSTANRAITRHLTFG